MFIIDEGFEEIELVTPLDLLRRAGADCRLVGISDQSRVEGRNGITISTDCSFGELVSLKDWDAVVLPGGPSSFELKDKVSLLEFLRSLDLEKTVVAAICAAPLILQNAGLLEGRKYTAHHSVRNELNGILSQKVVLDGAIITSQGAGTAIEFGLALIEHLFDSQVAKEIAQSIEIDL